MVNKCSFEGALHKTWFSYGPAAKLAFAADGLKGGHKHIHGKHDFFRSIYDAMQLEKGGRVFVLLHFSLCLWPEHSANHFTH